MRARMRKPRSRISSCSRVGRRFLLKGATFLNVRRQPPVAGPGAGVYNPGRERTFCTVGVYQYGNQQGNAMASITAKC